MNKKNIRINLHGFPLFEAKMEICEDVLIAAEERINSIFVIHGYNHGRAIRNYLRDRKRFLKDIREKYPECPGLKLLPVNEGATKIVLVRKNKGGKNT